jgi:CubicO group peptidase (beta-lactamase class C family)
MLLNGGFYNGKRYLSEETVKLFTTTYPLHDCKRRALGFDTPNFEKKSEVLPAEAGRHTFGHQGFTGTVVWCDPIEEMVYIFLSNRVYPNVEPNKLVKNGLRTKVMEVILLNLSLGE